MTVAQDAAAQDTVIQNCRGSCRWDLIVRDPSLATLDLYPAGDSREDCERTIEQFRATHLDRAAAQEMECVDSSRPDTWSHDLFPDTRPSNQP
jgi:hypothetical protein